MVNSRRVLVDGLSISRLASVVRALALAWLLAILPAHAGFTGSWQAIPTTDLPAWRAWSAMTWAGDQGRLVLWGGWGATFVNDLHTFDPVTRDWQMLEPHTVCPGNTGFDAPNGSDENGAVYDPINGFLWILNGGSGYRCLASRSAGAGTLSTVVVDATLTATEVDHYKDFWVSDLSSQALVTAYDPVSHSLFLDRPLSLATGSSYLLYADMGAGTWSYDFATGTYEKLEQRHWGYAGPLPTGSRLSPGFASSGSYAVLFGGVGSYNFTYGYYDNSTWKLDFASQSYSLLIQMGATGPAARAQIENQFVYDPQRDRFVLFGGRCRDPGRI